MDDFLKQFVDGVGADDPELKKYKSKVRFCSPEQIPIPLRACTVCRPRPQLARAACLPVRQSS